MFDPMQTAFENMSSKTESRILAELGSKYDGSKYDATRKDFACEVSLYDSKQIRDKPCLHFPLYFVVKSILFLHPVLAISQILSYVFPLLAHTSALYFGHGRKQSSGKRSNIAQYDIVITYSF